MKPLNLKWILVLVLALDLAGCAGSNIPDAKRTTGRDPTVAEVPAADETVRGEEDPAIVTLELGSALHEKRLSEGEDLPGNIIIPTTNLSAVPITTALQAVLTGTDVSLSWDTGALGDRLVTVMNLSGPLPKVVEKICSAAKVFCAYRNGSLELAEKETFVVSLPPVSKSTGAAGGAASATGNSMVEAINQLIGSKAQVDDQAGNILYTTDVEGQSRVKQYLQQLRNGRPLVVLQLYIWEVTLNKENSAGVNWSALKLGDLGPNFANTDLSSVSNLTSVASAAGAVSLGAVTTGRLNATILAGFLSTQGRLQTISNPQITFVSGSSASLKVGGKQRYISQVGIQTSNVSGTTTNSSTTNTVNTDSIETGLNVEVSGSYENGIVFANLDIDLTNIVSLNPTSSGGGTINLPQTADEKISTIVRVRPGDNLVMAGLVTSADTNSRQGIPLGDSTRLPMYGDDILQNRELVVMVKPSVVLFSDKNAVAEAKKKEESKGMPDAVVIDKDGPKTLAMPDSQPQARAQMVTAPALPPQAAPLKPELMTYEPNPQPLGDIAVPPSPEGAPVDRRLLQRGFSHAFDDLLKPQAPSLLSPGAGQ